MKRLLLITYAFPPLPSPGALRPGYLARYLPEFGWDVTVLTHSTGEPPFHTRVVRAPAKPIQFNAAPVTDSLLPQGSRLRRTLGAVKSMLLFPDDLALWILPAMRAGQRLLQAERFDAILSTALPTSAHVVGNFLSKKFSTPWIADYRDAWSGNPYMPWGPVKRSLEAFAERAVIANACDVTTVSQHIASHLSALHRREVGVIPNAYDPSDWEAIPNTRPAAFDLVYTGTTYDGKRSPDLLFQALAALRGEGHPAGRANVHFYGRAGVEVEHSARKYDLGSQVTLHGVVPRTDAMRAQRTSAALLIFLSMDPATANETGSKYLEYLGARRSMIVFGPTDSVMRETVSRNRLGWFASNVQDAIQAVKSAYERYANGQYETTGDASTLLAARDLARAFAYRLEGASETSSAATVARRVSRTPNDGVA